MRAKAFLPTAAGLFAACTAGGRDASTEQALSGTAQISLKGSSARVILTSDTEWTLSKTATVNTTTQTVTWTITATQGPTVAGRLVVNGTMTVSNKGAGPATIGNIVAN